MKSVISSMFRCVLATFRKTMGSSPLSTLVICGGSASSGRRWATRDNRSRTSFAALSRSRSSVNSTLICERSSRLAELRRSTPSIPEISFSMICVMRDSTTSEEAPRYRVSMLTTGRSTSGNSRKLNRVMAPMPRINSSSDITVAKTGRRTDRSEIIIAPASLGDARGTPAARAGFVRFAAQVFGQCVHRAFDGFHARAVAHLLRAFDDHPLSGAQAGEHLDAPGPASADMDFAARDFTFRDHVHVLMFGFRRQRLFGDDQRFAFVVREAHVEEHAGLERAVFVGQQRPHDDRTGGHVDARIDAGHRARKAASRKCGRAGPDRQAFAQRRKEIFGNREVELDDAGVIQCRDDITRADQRADADSPQAYAPRE